MENKLDRFFKNKLEDRTFEFDESAWAGMEQIIEMDEETQKEKRFWFWTGGLLGLFLIISLCWWLLNDKNESISPVNPKSTTTDIESIDTGADYLTKSLPQYPLQEKNTKPDVKEKSTKIDNLNSSSKDTFEQQAAQNNSLTATKQEKSGSPPPTLSNEKNRSKKQTETANLSSESQIEALQKRQQEDTNFEKTTAISSVKDTNQSLENGAQNDLTTINGDNSELGIHQNNKNANLPSDTNLRTRKNLNNKEALEKEAPPIPPNKTTLDKNIIEEKDNTKNKNTEEVKSKKSETDAITPSLNQDKTPTNQITIDITKALKNKTILPLEFGRDSAISAPNVLQTKPSKIVNRRIQLGMALATWIYPYSQSANLQYADFPDQTFEGIADKLTGFKIGLTATYPLNDAWSLRAEALYYQQRGTFQSVRSSPQIKFLFGSTQQTLELIPSSLHYLEIPVLGLWKRQKHQVIFGASLNFLLGLYGKIGDYTQNGTANAPTLNETQKGWMDKEGFAPIRAHALLGYQWQMNQRLGLGLRVNYTLGSILDKNYEAPYSFILLENQPLNLEARVEFKF